MVSVFWILLVVQLLMWTVFLTNLVYLRTVNARREADEQLPTLSILVPARNEAANLARLLPTLEAQRYPSLEVIVFDDDSSDDTARILSSYSGSLRLRVLSGSGPPPGWVGKVNALYQATRIARGEIYLFLDADVALISDGALENLVSTLLARPRNSALTVLPRFGGGGLLLVSLIPHSILAGLPWPLARLMHLRVLGAMNGQAWMIRASDYKRLEPHERVKAHVLEDVEIGRYLLQSGIVPVLTDATRLMTVYMYDDLWDAWRGFRKNAYLLMGGRVVPFLVFLIIFASVNWLALAISTYLFLSALLLKILADRVGRIPIYISLLAPISFILATVLQIDSAVSHWRGTVEWKDRIIPRQ